MRKLTNEEFIIRAKLEHNNKYCYSEVVFENTKRKVLIICPIHGKFSQLPSEHLRGCGCKKCVNENFRLKDDFIKQSSIKFGNKYDYSLVNYTNTNAKVKIICPTHGVFEQTPKNHIKSVNGCKLCRTKKEFEKPIKKDKEAVFKKKSNERHSNKYDYSLVKYKNSQAKVKIICSEHGVFEQTPNYHLGKYGECSTCKSNKAKENKLKLILEKFQNIHGDKYDYSKVASIKSKSKIKIKCKTHSFFNQSIEKHLIGQGCPKCSYNNENTRLKRYLSFVDKAKVVHKNKYQYQKSTNDYINIHSKINIICSTHGNFKQDLHNHIKHKQGCPKCSTSKGEILIKNFLKENNIMFLLQYKFDGCINPNTNQKLRFDFYLPDYNLCIEFDGEQHFNPMRFLDKKRAEKKLKQIKYRDTIKNNFCKNNSIKLLRIDYKKIKQTNKILEKYFKI